jgi:hypothetical protein
VGYNILGYCEEALKLVTHKFHPDKKKVGTSLYGFQKEVTLVSYAPKKNRCAVIIMYGA